MQTVLAQWFPLHIMCTVPLEASLSVAIWPLQGHGGRDDVARTSGPITSRGSRCRSHSSQRFSPRRRPHARHSLHPHLTLWLRRLHTIRRTPLSPATRPRTAPAPQEAWRNCGAAEGRHTGPAPAPPAAQPAPGAALAAPQPPGAANEAAPAPGYPPQLQTQAPTPAGADPQAPHQTTLPHTPRTAVPSAHVPRVAPVTPDPDDRADVHIPRTCTRALLVCIW